MATVGTKLLKKLTVRTFIGGKADILAYAMTGRKDKESEGSDVPLIRVLGNVMGYKSGESDFGSYVEMRGEFHATNLQTGEILESVSKCILPAVVGDSVAAAMHGGAESVEFAVELDVRFSEKAATMYEFSARSLIAPKAPKAINALMERLQSQGIEMTKPLALAAPKLSDADKAAQAAAEKNADASRAAAAAPAASAPAPQAKTKQKA